MTIRIRGRVSAAAVKALEAGKLPPVSEDALQGQIVAELLARGLIVLVTSRRRKVCAHCGKVNHSGDGADEGVPDLLVTTAVWPRGLWLGIEVKKPGAIRWSSPEQKLLATRGKIVVVQSVEDAVLAVLQKGKVTCQDRPFTESDCEKREKLADTPCNR